MKNYLKKMTILLLGGCMFLTQTMMMTGCSAKTTVDDTDRFNESVDASKTQIYIGYYNGGVGLTWLQEVKRLFEEEYPEYQVMIDTGKDEYLSEVLLSNIKTNRQDMYIGGGINYYKFVKQGLLVDLTEETTTPLTEYGEDESIEDKMNESLRAYYKTSDSKYYAVPFYQTYHHIIYDVDLFDQHNLWYKDGGGFVESTSDTKGAGQDGEYGTWDDGLPCTYSEFFALMDRMVSRGITPLTWSGKYADSYLPNFMASVIADYEGDRFATNWNYNGQIDVITNRNFTESPTNTFKLDSNDYATVDVTMDNYKEYMHSTVGKYYAAKLAKDICSNPLYRKYNYAESHTAVQRSFLMSNMEGVDKPIAMLIEGNWWINESKSVFEEMTTYDEKYSMQNRRFGIMPIPKADDGSSAEGHTIAPFSGDSAVFISENSPNKEIAIKFYRFMHTDECLRVFTELSYCLRPYDYDLSGIYDKLPYYVQNEIAVTEDMTFIYKLPTNDELKQDPEATIFMQYGGFMNTTWKGNTSNNMMIFFCDNAAASAKDYLLGMKESFERSLPASMQ